MMNATLEERKRQRIAKVAQEYRKQGYEVIVAPQSEQLPRFLAMFPIDIIARNNKENVVIEVRTRPSLSKAPALDEIAQALEGRTNWRFELVVTNPKDYDPLLANSALLEQSDVAYRLNEARQLATQEYGEAAILMTWSALEAILRHTAQAEELPSIQKDPSYLLKSLYTYGLLSKDQFQILQDGLHARNVIAHGYKSREQLAGLLDNLFRVADQLSATSVTV